jgi:hypothetical protein
MKRNATSAIKGQVIVLLVIVLAILGGGLWFLYSSRQDAEKNGRAFAALVAKRLAVNYDEKFFHVRLSAPAQITYLQSWRDRMLQQLRQLGVPSQPIEMKGDMAYTSYFFQPRGNFRAELKYPTTTAYLDMVISRGMTVWQIDEINLTWNPPPTPTPTPTPEVTATPTPPPPPAEQKPKRKRKGG